MSFCTNCGKQMNDGDMFCPACGSGVSSTRGTTPQYTSAPQYNGAPQYTYAPLAGVSDKDWLTALLLSILVGGLGVHRFYVGKIGTGVLWLLTAGVFGIGVIIDIIMIVTGSFTDEHGRVLKQR